MKITNKYRISAAVLAVLLAPAAANAALVLDTGTPTGSQMPLTVVHGSGASALAMRPIRYLIFDEASRLPLSAKGRRSDEGDPVALAKIRTTAFGDLAKIVYTSSPVEEGSCRISELFRDSTKERWHSRCPHCGSLQVLKMPEMHFDDATCQCLVVRLQE